MRLNDSRSNDLIYTERLSSNRTQALFLALMILFLLLSVWRVTTGHVNSLAVVFICFFLLFLFYSVNYRTLVICLTEDDLKLIFGIFTWRVPLDNIEECRFDDIPLLMKISGAGIHFMYIRKRYRASFNFLEYPRIVISFKKQVGPVKDISFSTRQPDEVLRLIREINP